MSSRSEFSTGTADLEAPWGLRAPHARVFKHHKGVFEPPITPDCTIVGIFKGLGSTGCETAMPGFGGKRASRARFPTGEADLKARRGLHAPHVRDFSPPQGVFESPRTPDCTTVGNSNELGFTGCEATKPGFGGK